MIRFANEDEKKKLSGGTIKDSWNTFTQQYNQGTAPKIDFSNVQVPTQSPTDFTLTNDSTVSQFQAAITQLAKTNPVLADQYYAELNQLRQTPGSSLYTPYNAPTSKAMKELEKLGLDMSGPIDDAWFQKYSYLQNDYRYTATGTNAAAPTTKSPKREQQAYWYKELYADYEQTQKVQEQWDQLKKELSFKATRADRNYSDDEILNSIDWSKYGLLTKMDDSTKINNNLLQLTTPVDYTRDNLKGVLWAARNGSGADDLEAAAMAAVLGKGNTWRENKSVSAKLNPESDQYDPYALGSTGKEMDEAALYFGTTKFDKNWLKDHRDYLNGDATAQKQYTNVYEAEKRTQKAEEELAALHSEIDTLLSYGSLTPDVILDGLLDDYPTLRAIDESLNSGKLLNTTRAIDYRWQDIEADVRRRYAEAEEREKLPTFTQKIAQTMAGVTTPAPQTAAPITTPAAVAQQDQPQMMETPIPVAPTPTPPPTPSPTQTEQAITENRNNTYQAAAPTVVTKGTDIEKTVAKFGSNVDFPLLVPQLAQGIHQGKLTGNEGRDFVQQQTNDFTAKNYMAAKRVTDQYDTVVKEQDELKKKWAEASGELEIYDMLTNYEATSPFSNPWSPSEHKQINGKSFNLSADYNPMTGKFDLTNAQRLPDDEFRPETDAIARKAAEDYAASLNTGLHVVSEEDGEEEFSLGNSMTEKPATRNVAIRADENLYYFATLNKQDNGEYTVSFVGKVPQGKSAIPSSYPVIDTWNETPDEDTQAQINDWVNSLPDFSAYADEHGLRKATLAEYDQTLEEKANLARQIQDKQDQLDSMQSGYDAANDQIKLIRNGARAAALLDIQANAPKIDASGFKGHLAMQQQIKDYTDKAMALPNALDLIMDVGSEYRPTEWAATTVFQTYLDQGASTQQVSQIARMMKTEAQQDLDALNRATQLAEGAGVELSGDMLNNVNREKAKLTQEAQEADDYLLQTRSDFAQTVADVRADALSHPEKYQGTLAQYAADPNLDQPTITLADNLSMLAQAGSATSGDAIQPHRQSYMNELTQAERDTYLYKLKTEGAQAAWDYYNRLGNAVDVRRATAETEELANFAKEYPVLAAITSIGIAPASAQGALYAAASAISGQEINPNSAFFKYNRAEQTLNATAKETLLAPLDEGSPAYQLMGMVYDGIVSGAKSLENAALTGPFGPAVGPALMGLEAAGSRVMSVKADTGSDFEALAMGTVTFFTNFVTEMVTTQNIADAIKAGEQGVRELAKSVLESPFIEETVGEVIGDAAEYWSDDLIRGKMSERQKAITEYKKTMSEEDAVARANRDFWEGLAETAFTTLISTGLTEGSGYAAGYAQYQFDTSSARHAPGSTARSVNTRINPLSNPINPTPNLVENPAQSPAVSTSGNVNNSDVAARQAATLTASLNADATSQTAAVSSVLMPENGTDVDATRAAAAGLHLANTLGAEKAVDVARTVLAEASVEGIDQAEVQAALTTAAITNGEAAQVLQEISETGITGGDVERLIAAANRDTQNPGVMQQARQNIFDTRVALRGRDLIADGALNGVKPYQDALNNAKASLRKAEGQLSEAQDQQQVMGENLQTLSSEYLADPSNQATHGALQQATKDMVGQTKVVEEYQQSVENAEASVKKAQTDLDATQDSLMKDIRQQALADVQAEDQAQAEAEAAAAEAQAQANYESAIAALPPAAPLGSIVEASMIDGTPVGITGVAYIVDGGDETAPATFYYTTSDGKVIADSLVPSFPIDTLSTDQLFHAAMAKHPKVALPESLPAMKLDTGEIIQITGFDHVDTDTMTTYATTATGEILPFTDFDLNQGGTTLDQKMMMQDVFTDNYDILKGTAPAVAQAAPEATTPTENTTPAEAQPAASQTPALEPWQDPQYHGKVKKPEKAKVGTKNFKKWFSDPTGDLSNPDGTPKVFYRGFGSYGSHMYIKHESPVPNQPFFKNFYVDQLPTAKTYSGQNAKKLPLYDMVNWETAKAAMQDIGYTLEDSPNPADPTQMGYMLKKNGYNVGWYAENDLKKFNNTYGGNPETKGVFYGYVSAKNPLVLDAHGGNWTGISGTVKDKDGNDYYANQSTDSWAIWAFQNGYDTVIVKNVTDNAGGWGGIPGTDIITSQSSQFKSIYNTGKWNKDNPDIRYYVPGTFVHTGKPVSGAITNIRNRLLGGKSVTTQDIMTSPEVQWLEANKLKGISTDDLTPEELATRIADRVADVLEMGSYSGEQVWVDGNKTSQYDGDVRQEKRLDVVMGPPGAGKSSVAVNPLSQKYGARVLDPDMIAAMYPEYNNGLGSNYLHEEALQARKEAEKTAIQNGDNVVLPLVGWDFDFTKDDIQPYRDAGYKVYLHLVDLDYNKALGRALGRAITDGQYVPVSYINDKVKNRPRYVYELLKGEDWIAGYEKLDNDVPKSQPAKIIESSGMGGLDELRGPGGNISGTGGTDSPAQHSGGGEPPDGGAGESQVRPKGAPKKSPQRIAKDLTNKLGVGQAIGTRKMNNVPRAVLGYYEQRAKYIAVRNNQAGNYAVTMHEIGHAIADKIGMTGTADMVANLDPVFASNYSPDELPGEAFAEFMWRYMESDENGRAFAGDEFVDSFERALQENGLAKDVHKAATQLRAWVNASTSEQIGAIIHPRTDRPKLGFREQARRIIDSVIDPSNAAEDVNSDIREQTKNSKVSFDQDVRKNSLMKNQAGKRAFFILTEGMTDSSWTRTGGDSLAKVFEDAGLKSKDVPLLERYMLALHSKARDEQGKPVFDDHITPEARKAFIDDVQQNHPEVARAEKGFQAWRKEFLQKFLVDTGYLSQEAFDKMNAMYEHYVPTMRVKDERYRNMNKAGGKSYTVRQATGSTEDIWSPLDTFMGMVDSIVTMVSANNAALAWDNAYRNNELGAFGRRITPDSKQVTVNVEALQQQLSDLLMGNLDDDIFQQAIDLVGTTQSQWVRQNGSSLPNVLTVQHADGSKSYYEIFDTELYKLLASIDDRAQNKFWDMAGHLTRGMTALTTGSNPVFAARNFLRDFQNSVNYGSWASNYATGAAKWLSAAYDVWRNKGEYQDYAALGGGGWTRIEPGTKKGAAEYRSALYKGYNTENVGRTAKFAGQKLWNAITLARLNEIVEQTSRYAEYKYGKHDKSTAAGRADAFLAAQDVTVDFSRSGNSNEAKTLKQLIPFFNASLQGVYRTGRMLTEAERGRTGARFTKTIVNTALLSALCNALLMKNSDDDEKKEFAMMSDELKSQHFYLPNFAPNILGQQPLIRIPLAQDPLTYAVHGAVTNAMWNGTTDEAVIDLAAVANTILDNLNPLGSGTVLQPLIGIGQNKNWYGSRIVPSRMADSDRSLQYTAETPDIFIQAGRVIGSAAPDSVLASPLNLQYLAEQYTGFLGQMLIPAFSKDKHTGELGGLRAAITGAQKRLTSDPLVSNDVVNSFYDGAAMFTKVTDAVKRGEPMNMLRRGLTEAEATAAYEEAKEMTSSKGIIGQTKSAINDLYAVIDEINANDTLTDEEKYMLTREKRRELLALTLEANEAIGAYREKYITGENVANRALFAGVTAHIPTAYEKMPQTFKDDEGKEYMKRAKEVYEATGSDTALPRPSESFTLTDKYGKEHIIKLSGEEWETYIQDFKREYEKYSATSDKQKAWATANDAKAKQSVLSGINTHANNEAKKLYAKRHGIILK